MGDRSDRKIQTKWLRQTWTRNPVEKTHEDFSRYSRKKECKYDYDDNDELNDNVFEFKSGLQIKYLLESTLNILLDLDNYLSFNEKGNELKKFDDLFTCVIYYNSSNIDLQGFDDDKQMFNYIDNLEDQNFDYIYFRNKIEVID